ncbi:CHC2 zinc finger domain-containing protein [Streptomyces sp. H27-C3]|uniref:CHC2 zinc finger domain-containing protein n=1 Tax=Streptomyces sp. H27-C3 TaxID=3046305 RepID=UPI0024BA28F5|nr:CHC2 zinc finger domain-containing protein [Streptomyces sp. H27-C3]MDJ0463156.1 CHC2 zinc finger domain-containing protein [Streptomyces sp. H27-C3]
MTSRSGSTAGRRDDLIPGDVPSALAELGVEVLGDDGDNYKIRCPAHAERTGRMDRRPSCYVHVHSGQFICFSCEWAGSFARFVAYMQGTDSAHANAWIAAKGTIGRALRLLKGDERHAEVEPGETVTEAQMVLFTTPPEPARRRRGLTLDACEQFGVRWDLERRCWILPIRDPEGTLLGWQEKSKRHFRNFPDGVEKGTALFGSDVAFDGPLILVESPLDPVRMYSVGVHGGKATFGAHVKHEQMRLAMELSDTIILGQDNDTAGRQSRNKLYYRYRYQGAALKFWNYLDTGAKDPGEMTGMEIWDCLDASYSPLRRKLK